MTSHGQKKRSDKTNGYISCMPETILLILLTKEAIFISYLQAGCFFDPNLKCKVNLFLHPQKSSCWGFTCSPHSQLQEL